MVTTFQKRQRVLGFLEGQHPAPRGCLSMYSDWWTEEMVGARGDSTQTGYKKKGTWNYHFRKYNDVYVRNNTISYSYIPPMTLIRAFTYGHMSSFPLLVVYRCLALKWKKKKKKKKNQSCPKRNEEVRALQCLADSVPVTARDVLSGLSNILNFHLPAPSPL